MRPEIKKLLFKYLTITLGCIVYSASIALFLDPSAVASGGVTGLAIIINQVTGLRTGLVIIIINVPLFILGTVYFGRNFAISTLYVLGLTSGLIELLHFGLRPYLPFTDDIIINACMGGALMGLGLGVIFLKGATTAGTDIIVKILRKKFRHIKTGVISLSIDCVIIGISGIIFRDLTLFFYTLLGMMVMCVCLDFALYGSNTAKLLYIITDHENVKPICDRILKDLDAGATIINSKGAYTNAEKAMILCAVKKYAYPRLRDYIHEIDPLAFTIVSSATEIYGEGYKAPEEGEL